MIPTIQDVFGRTLREEFHTPAMAQTLPFPANRHEKIFSLYSHWSALKPSAGLPSRKDLDPTKIPRLLPNVWLIDVVPPLPRFRYRLIGTAVADARGYDQTGSFIYAELSDFSRSQTYADLQIVLNGTPSWRRGVPDQMHRLNDISGIERIFLPLASDGVTVDMVLALTVFQSQERSR